MNVRMHKSFLNLPPSEKEIINREMTKEVQKQLCHEEAELQKTWLKFACLVLNKNFGFGKQRCLMFLANWREMYRINNQLKTKEEQLEYLNAELAQIFGEEGYPTAFIDKLENM